MSVEMLQLRVMRILTTAISSEGFALGGGNALQMHLNTYRPSDDVDAYADSLDPTVFQRAGDGLVRALRDDGLTARHVTDLDQDWFRAIDVRDPETGAETRVDLGYDRRSNPPVFIDGIGPVLSVEDVVFGKIRALVDRRAERDLIDLDAILSDGRWTMNDVFDHAKTADPSITRKTFRGIVAAIGKKDPVEFLAYGVGPKKLRRMIERLNACGRCRVCGRELTSDRTVAKGIGRTCSLKVN